MGRRFGPNFDIVHAQQIAMFSYLTGSLDYALSNRIFILYERITFRSGIYYGEFS